MCKAICSVKGCNWACLYLFINQTQSLLIKTLQNKHTQTRQVKNKLANKEWLVKKLAPKLREQPSINDQEAYNQIKVTYNVMVPNHFIFKALKKAREIIEGLYAKRNEYGEELL